MLLVRSLAAISDRSLKRLVIAAALVLAVGAPIVIAVYVLDQRVDPGLTMAERRIEQLKAAAKDQPNDPGLRLALADAYVADGKPQDALAQYDAVLLIAPANMRALLGKAEVLEVSGDLGDAQPLYQKAVDLAKGGEFAAADTSLERAWFGLGSVALKQSRFTDAITALESAAKIDGTDADAWYLLGRAQLGAGNPVKAVQAERNAVTFVPMGWSEPYETMREAYTALGQAPGVAYAQAMVDFVAKRYDDAKGRLVPLLDGPAAGDAALGLGMIAETQGDATAAIGWYRKALVLRPGNTTATGGLERLGVADPAPSGAPSTSPQASGG